MSAWKKLSCFLRSLGDALLNIDARLVPVDDEIVPREIFHLLTRRLVVLYATALVTLWICAWRFYGSAPWALSVGTPLVLSTLVLWRMAFWHKVRNSDVTTSIIIRSIARLQTVGPLVGLAFSLWGIALFPYGDALQQDMIHYLVLVTALTATLCLCSTPVASLLLVTALMAPLGLVEWVEEPLLDAVSALSGSGPAFVYRFIDALAAAGASLGFPADQALRLATATVEGAGMLAAQADAAPAELADRVASKGGSTREGLYVLDRDGALEKLLIATLTAARDRNVELAAAAR